MSDPLPERGSQRDLRMLRPALRFLAPYKWAVVGASIALVVTAGVIGLMGIVPGMPNLVFLSVAVLLGVLAYFKAQVKEQPVVEEVEEFVRAKNLSVDSQRFWDYYDTTDWTIEANGKNPRPMKNWKSVARNWSDRNGNGKPAPSASEDRIDYGGIMQQVKNASR